MWTFLVNKNYVYIQQMCWMHFLPHQTFLKLTSCTIWTCIELFTSKFFFSPNHLPLSCFQCHIDVIIIINVFVSLTPVASCLTLEYCETIGMKVYCITGMCVHERRIMWTQLAREMMFVLLIFNWRQDSGFKRGGGNILQMFWSILPWSHFAKVL